jgi:hypothetical protein
MTLSTYKGFVVRQLGGELELEGVLLRICPLDLPALGSPRKGKGRRARTQQDCMDACALQRSDSRRAALLLQVNATT